MVAMHTRNIDVKVSEGDAEIYHVTATGGEFLGYIIIDDDTCGFSQAPSVEMLLADEMFDIATAVTEIDKALTE